MENPKLSIVVPCYNEEKSITSIVERFKEVKPDFDVEIVLVNNGSKDGSRELIERLAKENIFITPVHVKENQGYGYGILSGLKQAKGEYISWTHADLQTDINDAIRAYNIISKESNPKDTFVKGKRYGRPIFDRFFTAGMSVFETAILGTTLRDINAQPNLFHRELLTKTQEPPHDFSFDLYFLYTAKENGMKVVRFPVEFKKRIHGESHWNTSLKAKWKFIKRTVDFSVRLRKKIKVDENADNNTQSK
jgi:glycosyltransferase involved in cell wall biosynthesis